MRVGLGVLGLALVFPAAASADTTPVGPATLKLGSAPVLCPGISGGPGVVVAWEAEVGDGGQGGMVRPVFGDVAGDRVELPAQPGTYRFAAPHLYRDAYQCGPDSVGLIQETGAHAVLRRDQAAGARWVDVVREGRADERIDGARLAIREVIERDADQDRLGDATEDRTDLRVSATGSRVDSAHARVIVTVTNAGPLAADLPTILTSLPNEKFDSCKTDSLAGFWVGPGGCPMPRIEPGGSRTVAVTGDAPGATTVFVRTKSEGPDLAYGDNETSVGVPAAPAFTLAAARSQRLGQGVTVKVRAAKAGRARVTVAFAVRGRTVKLGKVVTLKADAERAVTVRARGAKLRSLERAVRSGALTAQVTVRTIGGRTPVTATTKVVR